MAKYIIKRILYILLVFLILSLLLFLIYNMIPRDQAYAATSTELKNLPSSQRATFDWGDRYYYWQCYYGENGSIFERYLRWIGLYPYTYYDGSVAFNGMLEGNFGKSIVYNKPVVEVISAPMGNTIFINVFATIIGLGITIPLGIFCAVKKGTRRDIGVQVFTIIGYSLPVFIIGIVFMFLFSVVLGWFPVSGSHSTFGYDEMNAWQQFWDRMYYMALPLIVMTFCSLGGMTRYVRAAMIDALSLDCIKTARAKGLKERTVIYSHAFRNALIPIITLVIGWFLGVFSGSMMIENIFSLNGIGLFYYNALNSNDNEVVLALQMFYIFISLAGNLIIDIAYGFIDPRIRVNK
ncbi:MAG: ABC transporter permease [Erysipelotrichaceae bacterium]|nr:ABC transporter permease [Erysipelotrichaceae bacterium]